MHDCHATQEKLIDLVFDELPDARKQQLLTEVEACNACRAEYQSMTQTLNVFDQSFEVAMPEESYWQGYENRLRERLNEEPIVEKHALWSALLAFFSSLSLRPVWAVPVAVGLILILFAGWWFSRGVNQIPSHNEIVLATPRSVPSPSPTIQPGTDVKPESKETPKMTLPHKPRRKSVEVQQNDVRPQFAFNPNFELAQPVNSQLANPDVLRHFERAEILLRGFRNADPASSNLAYEKQQAHKLLYENIVLRRSAEGAGDLPVADVLSSLEPVLLDIKNLPDQTTSDDVQEIKEIINRKRLIGTLSVYSSQTVAINETNGQGQ